MLSEANDAVHSAARVMQLGSLMPIYASPGCGSRWRRKPTGQAWLEMPNRLLIPAPPPDSSRPEAFKAECAAIVKQFKEGQISHEQCLTALDSAVARMEPPTRRA